LPIRKIQIQNKKLKPDWDKRAHAITALPMHIKALGNAPWGAGKGGRGSCRR
jgi:hypothetical protein